MTGQGLLRPQEAEAVIEERIEWFGIGALPRVSVTELADGSWQVRWDHLERIVAPMTREAWSLCLQENVGSLDAGDLQI